MQSFETIYDAGTMVAVDRSMVVAACFGTIAFSTIAAFAWRRWRLMPKREARFSLSQTLGPPLGMSAMAIAALGYLAFAAIEDALWASDYAARRYEIIDGCVRHFNELVETDHDLGVDTFSLNGRQFKLSDSQWRLGYHVSHHRGSPIHENTHLRVFANGSRLLRIDVSPDEC